MTSPVRLGLIGAGWGKVHAQAVSQLEGRFTVEAVWSRNQQRCEAFADELGLAASACETDWQKLIRRDDVDVVVIAAPDQLHHALAIEAAAQGKHLICEKPLAQTPAEAAEMLEAAREAGVEHFVGFLWRYAAPVATVKGLLDSGRLGTAHTLDMQFRIGPPRAEREWQRVRRGGVFSNLMVHLVDLARYLSSPGAESPGKQVWRLWAHTAASQDAQSDGLPLSHAWLHMESASGIQVRLQASQDWVLRTAFPLRVEVHGSTASATAYANPLRPELHRVDLVEQLSGEACPQPLLHPGGMPAAPTSGSAGGYLLPATRHLYEQFVLPALSGRPVAGAPTFQEGLDAQRLIEAAFTAAETGLWQSVEV